MANIFEFLELPANHRSKDKVTMKVKNFDEVPDSKKPRRAVYYAQIKKDGIFCHVVKFNGKYGFFSRTGMELTNTKYLESQLKVWDTGSLLDGVYMTELCCDFCSLEALSGIFNPNRKEPLDLDQDQWCRDSYLCFHDYVYTEDFILGQSNGDYSQRYNCLQGMIPMEFSLLDVFMVHLDDVPGLAKYHIANDEEGIVIKRASECWEAGHKGYKQMKIVKGVDYDLECIGAEAGTGKYKGKVANLIFRWKDGREVKAMLGNGWTHEDAEEMFENHKTDEIFAYLNGLKLGPVGKIFHVHALQESSKGVLRLPKVCELRIDKDKADV